MLEQIKVKTILMITDNIPDQINGVNTTYQNIEQCAIMDGYAVRTIHPGHFPHVDCPGYPEVKLSLPWKISRKIKEINADYIHIQTEGPLGLAARWYCCRHNLKYNTSYHTKFPEFLKKMYNIPTWLTYCYVRWFHKDSFKILTTTQTMVEELIAHGFKGNVIPWTRGVDRSVFNSTSRKKTISSSPVLLSVGRISKEKGLDEFCQLDYPGAVKIIVGDGPYREELESKYPNVIFAGAKTKKELAEYYANADVFVFTSRTDTFGIVIIESLACGTPVAAYSVPGPIDILDAGITGHMSDDLTASIDICLGYSRDRVEHASQKWTWDNCWHIFKNNLVSLQ